MCEMLRTGDTSPTNAPKKQTIKSAQNVGKKVTPGGNAPQMRNNVSTAEEITGLWP